jgi:hypothetical protein
MGVATMCGRIAVEGLLAEARSLLRRCDELVHNHGPGACARMSRDMTNYREKLEGQEREFAQDSSEDSQHWLPVVRQARRLFSIYKRGSLARERAWKALLDVIVILEQWCE